MEISAALVKELRERTGLGMMECKKALLETAGNIESAIDLLRKSGMAKADKKAGRVAAEGRIIMALSPDKKRGVMVEINCETDFVAKDANFIAFCNKVATQLLNKRPADLDALMGLPEQGGAGATLDDVRKALVAKIGEKIAVRRFTSLESPSGVVGAYLHGVRIGVLTALKGGNEELAKDIAMHVAASKPAAVSADDVAPELIAKEREIYTAQAADSGKPPEIIEKMVSGRVTKFLREITLLGQPFVKNPDITVEQLLKAGGATVLRFERYEVGEGIEKKSEDFAAEVMAQVRGA